MTIYETLKNDHENVKELLAQLLMLTQDEAESRHMIIQNIRDELIPHARAEEAVFYNTLRETEEAKDLVMEAFQEHMQAETYLRMLQLRDKIDAKWKDTARKLQEVLEHHIAEEEGEMFILAQRVFTDEEAQMMASAFERLKAEIKPEGLMKNTFDMVVNMMPPRFTSVFRKTNVGLDSRLSG